MRKTYKKEDVLRVVRWLCGKFIVFGIDKSAVESAAHKDYRDYEDAVQYFSAFPNQPGVIITRDKQGFDGFGTLVMTPAEFVAESRK